MPNSIPDLQFETYDDFRKWERAIDTMSDIVDMVKDNSNNLALCEELLGILHNALDMNINWVAAHIDNQVTSDDQVADIFAYQSESAEMVFDSLEMADQVRVATRRDGQKDG